MPAHAWTKRQHAKFKATTIAKRKARALAELGQDAVVAINESAEPDTVRIGPARIESRSKVTVNSPTISDAIAILETTAQVLRRLFQ